MPGLFLVLGRRAGISGNTLKSEKHMRKLLVNLEEIIASFFLAVMIVVLVANVFMRIATSRSIIWMEEIAYLCFAWVVFVGASAAYKRNLHSSIDMVIKLFPPHVRRFVAILGMALTLATCLIMVVLSYNFAIHAWEKYTPYLYIRYTFIDLAVTVGFAFMSVHCLAFIRNMYRYGDFTKELPLYATMANLDVVMSGTADTEFHSQSQRDRERAAGGREDN